MSSRKFFDYDDISYYFNNFDEHKLSELNSGQYKSADDSLKMGVITGRIPNDILDLDFIDKLEYFGYEKSIVDKSKFKDIDQIFIEKPLLDYPVSSCIYVYRDILIFKKKGMVVGTAKICFTCNDSQIKGTDASTEMFGQDGDYERLKKVLKNH